MSGSVILESPVIIALYALAAFLLIFDRVKRDTHGIFTYAAGAIVLGATAYAVLTGASLREAALALLIYLVFIMGVKK
ncbi:MAG: hypothetical protein IJP43_01880 [Oscillospiraceae bacterium]|nr:hypothetical protein [Oscillospiraceae bacterium]